MNSISNSIALAAFALAVSATGVLAQSSINNPGNSGGPTGSQIAMPNYPAGYGNPALSPGRRLTAATASTVPADENPGVAGATGLSIVPGDNSTIAGDRRATIEQRTGGAGSDGGAS